MEEKKRYYVCHLAEGETCGEIWLTEEQAKLVAYVTDQSNWSNVGGDGWGGSFSIADADEEDAIMASLRDEEEGYPAFLASIS